MRTLVDIPKEQLEELKYIGEEENLTRAEMIRQAIAGYIKTKREKAIMDVFGLWKDRGEDGLEYQERIRSEWE